MATSYTDFAVHGLTSEDEADTIKSTLHELRGVQIVTVDVDEGQVEVGYDEELHAEEEIKSGVRDLGYDVG